MCVQTASDAMLAFDMAPVGLLVARARTVHSCNEAFSRMFGEPMLALVGAQLRALYPSQADYSRAGERALASMHSDGCYTDERVMRRADGALFWCRVWGQASDRSDPFSQAVWAFTDLSWQRSVCPAMTPRERDVAQGVVEGKSAKELARLLGIGHRTVEAYRARLMRKFNANSSTLLAVKLLEAQYRDPAAVRLR